MKRTCPAVPLYLALISLFFPTIGKTQETLFATRTYETGSISSSVAVGDFNGDGRLDFVTANYDALSLSVFMNKGDGTFASKMTIAANYKPLFVMVSDFNGDGKLDIAVTNGVSNTVSILLGKGDGTFKSRVNYPTGNYPIYAAAGDLNGDGKMDIITANYGTSNFNTGNYDGSSISVLLGNGDGTFAAKIDKSMPASPQALVVGDFNGDSKSDVAVANVTTNTVSILQGNGNGTFSTQLDYSTGNRPSAIAALDLNGDGKTDLVVANSGSNTLSVLLGNGDGTFTVKANLAAALDSDSIAIKDFNGDNLPDIVTANAGVINSISVLIGNGDGTFANRVDYLLGFFPVAIAAGDFNGDSRQDVLFLNQGYTNVPSSGVTVLFGNGNGAFAATADYATGITPESVVAGDFNHDGRLDLVVANAGNLFTYGSTISALLGNGDGTFQPKVDYGTGSRPSFIASGDFNGDGDLDLAVANYNSSSISVLLGRGNGTFTAKIDSAVNFSPQRVAVGDFNGDGKADLVVANQIYNATTRIYDAAISILLGKGNGTFAAKMDSSTGSATMATAIQSIAVGDLDGDGKSDLVVAKGNSQTFYVTTISVLLGKGNGTFSPEVTYSVGSGPYAVVIGDFNGDGKPDIATANYASGSVSILLGKGRGTFATAVEYPVDAFIDSLLSADCNGDGKPDLIVANSSYNEFYVLLGNGEGTFGPCVTYVTANGPNSVTLGDFNGDGKLDLVTADGGFVNTVSVLLNIAERSRVSGLLTLEGIFPSASAQPVTFTFRSPGFADFAPTLNASPLGEFAVNLPKRSGILHIKSAKYLASNVTVDATSGDVSGVTALLRAGDANNDNRIDPTDFSVFVSAYDSDINIPGTGYDPTCDFNGDGFVDATDFTLFVGNYNRIGDL